ncbi:MAG TPA: hypothetical protein VKN99_01095 [Polyangia bacterium]|nr:hypothetical protein [Polyangia bacterium]
MWRYLKQHERFVRAALERDLAFAQLKAFQERQLSYLQHERLVHLLITLAVALCFLATTGFCLLHPSAGVFAAGALLGALLLPYLVHYFRLENGVQRLYHLSNRIDEKLGVVSARYE